MERKFPFAGESSDEGNFPHLRVLSCRRCHTEAKRFYVIQQHFKSISGLQSAYCVLGVTCDFYGAKQEIYLILNTTPRYSLYLLGLWNSFKLRGELAFSVLRSHVRGWVHYLDESGCTAFLFLQLQREAGLSDECQRLRVALEAEKGKKEEVEGLLRCIICVARPRNVLVEPCLHFYVCSQCSQGLSQCPICRSKITSRIEVKREEGGQTSDEETP